MWYWVRKLEGVFFIPFTPLFVTYWKLRGTPYFYRCRWCGRWLVFDPRNFRLGMCENCFQEKFESDPVGLHQLPEIYEGVDAPSRVNPGFDSLFKKISKRISHGRVLEVGCASGYLLSRINLEPESLYGVDITPGGVKIANSWVKGGNFCLADARNIPYKSNTFDYLICTEVLEHIEGDEAMKECYRVLKPGGMAFITVPNGKGVAGQGYFLAHIRAFTLESITKLLKERGFEIVSRHKLGLYIPFVSSFISTISSALGKNLPFFPALSNLRVPEFLAIIFFIECRKPAQERE